MKKETVSKDPLAEKIEEILTPYPDPMSRNDFRIVCHIGTRTSLYLLQSGLVPCKNNGKKTRCYKIAKKDGAEYLYRRESDPMHYTPPSGWYYNYPKHKKPAASLERKPNYKGEERLPAKEWYAQLPGCTDRCASLRGDRPAEIHNRQTCKCFRQELQEQILENSNEIRYDDKQSAFSYPLCCFRVFGCKAIPELHSALPY